MSGKSVRVYGLQVVQGLVERKPHCLVRLWVRSGEDNPRLRELLAAAADIDAAVERCGADALQRLAGSSRHQGAVAEIRPDNIHAENELETLLAAAGNQPLLLALDGVQDPHNLGACLRSAAAAGVDLVLLPRDRSADLSGAARRAAAGAAELLPVVRVGNLARSLRRLKKAGIWLAGAAEQAPSSIHEQDLTGPLALVVGAEGDGLRRLTADLCDYLVSIPAVGSLRSLNVSVATGVCLFEIRRQRRLGGPGDHVT